MSKLEYTMVVSNKNVYVNNDAQVT